MWFFEYALASPDLQLSVGNWVMCLRYSFSILWYNFMLKWWYAIDESAIIHIKTCTHFVDMWYIWYLYDALHDDKYRCLNECVTAKMQFYHLSLIESGIINVSLSDQHFQSIIFSVFCNFSDLIHFAHETWLHFTLLCRKIFESKRLQWYCFWFYILILQKVFVK